MILLPSPVRRRWTSACGFAVSDLTNTRNNFRDNKINADLLPRLTGDDLKDLGVFALGYWSLVAGTLSPKSADAPPPNFLGRRRSLRLPRVPEALGRAPPDHRHVLRSRRLDELLPRSSTRRMAQTRHTYLDEASGAVTEFGGFVLKKLGDGLMALFGYPHAQENDAERAVRAALAIQRALIEINARNASQGPPQLSARIGLDSGQLVVDATGEVFGDAPNIAARNPGGRCSLAQSS